MQEVLNLQKVQSELPRLASLVVKGDVVHIKNKKEKMFFISENISPERLVETLPRETLKSLVHKYYKIMTAQKQNPNLPEDFVAELVDVLEKPDDKEPHTFTHLEVEFTDDGKVRRKIKMA